MSPSNTLTKEDWKKWAQNFFVFSLPALLAFFMALQGGGDIHFALGAGYSALLASLIDLFGKYKAGA